LCNVFWDVCQHNSETYKLFMRWDLLSILSSSKVTLDGTFKSNQPKKLGTFCLWEFSNKLDNMYSYFNIFSETFVTLILGHKIGPSQRRQNQAIRDGIQPAETGFTHQRQDSASRDRIQPVKMGSSQWRQRKKTVTYQNRMKTPCNQMVSGEKFGICNEF